ncbi:MAG: hypothetical protein KIS66_04180 [Fimbriimonadaceae bacterium]|nr:hypothetical protein [Fimbriimonadaceae bacterium]
MDVPFDPPMDTLRAFRGQAPRRIPHYEHWSCPDAETYLSGVDYYEHPRRCRLRLAERYPQLRLPVPESDDPLPRPKATAELTRESSEAVRWGAGESWEWGWGRRFSTVEEVLRFSPLERPDFTDIPVVESRNYVDEDTLYREFRARYPAEWGDLPPEDGDVTIGFYNTLFMWPLLTFGWERFLEASVEPEFERVLSEFAELSRRTFRAMARLPVHVVICHDDIVGTRGPFLSPAWMRRLVFPRYEEFWSILRAAGKRVVFMSDGNMDAFADDVFACGASGIVTEPYTDFRALARRHPDCVLAGEGDNRVLTRNDPAEIEAMVERMLETARMTGGYFLCIGNHIPWDIPPPAIERYLDLCAERGVRG